MQKLKKYLDQAVQQSVGKHQKIAVLFSGGLDSSVIARLSSQYCNPVLFTVGIEGSKDADSAQTTARQLHLPLVMQTVSKKDIELCLPRIEKILKRNNLGGFLQLQIGMPEFLAFQLVKEHSFAHVLTGLGADSLFLGFDYFRGMLEKEGKKGIQKFVKQQMKKEIWGVDVVREQSLAKFFGLNVYFPYLDSAVIREALKIPVSENIHSPKDMERKHILREIALEIGVPREAALRKKSAIQYGSGVSKLLKKIKLV